MNWLFEPCSAPALFSEYLLLTVSGSLIVAWAYRTKRLDHKSVDFLLGAFSVATLANGFMIQPVWTPFSHFCHLLTVWWYCWLPGGILGMRFGSGVRFIVQKAGLKTYASKTPLVLGCGEHGTDAIAIESALTAKSIQPVRDWSKTLLRVMSCGGALPWVYLIARALYLPL